MAGLERERRPSEDFPPVVEVLGPERAVGKHKALVVKGSATLQPRRRRVGTDEREQTHTGDGVIAVLASDQHRR
jgi:hypothetical protein